MNSLTSTEPTSREESNLLSFSTATTFLAFALRMDLVSEPGPGPTSHTQQSVRSPATFTSLSVAGQRNILISTRSTFPRPLTSDIEVQQKVLAELRLRREVVQLDNVRYSREGR